MTGTNAASPKEALAAYLTEVGNSDTKLYKGGTQFNFFTWRALQVLALVVALGGSLASALLGSEKLKGDFTLWVLSIVLPLVSGALTASISQTKVAELHLNRRRNFAKLRYLLDDGWAQFYAASTDAEYTSIHRTIAIEFEKVRSSWAE
jgi:hypothetical protein